ncbi:MAG: hypothetical protein JKX72_11465 [Robiginitomaculum sp.]|nr:hypothetical protein [Robiginitomaculum sp.]
MRYIFLFCIYILTALHATASEPQTCQTGLSLHIKEIVVKPSRIEDVLVEAHYHDHVEVHESQELVSIPATWTWIQRPKNYIAPKFINIPNEHTREGETICVNYSNRPIISSFDTIQKLDGSTFTKNYNFLGQAVTEKQCVTSTGTTSVMSVVKTPYDPEFMEKDGQIRLLMQGKKLMIRKTPNVMNKIDRDENKYMKIGTNRLPATLKQVSFCANDKHVPTATQDHFTKRGLTNWKAVYLKGYVDAARPKEGQTFLTPMYDLSNTFLGIGIDPKSMDVIWHAFAPPCNMVGNWALNKHGEPKLDARGRAFGKAALLRK